MHRIIQGVSNYSNNNNNNTNSHYFILLCYHPVMFSIEGGLFMQPLNQRFIVFAQQQSIANSSLSNNNNNRTGNIYLYPSILSLKKPSQVCQVCISKLFQTYAPLSCKQHACMEKANPCLNCSFILVEDRPEF